MHFPGDHWRKDPCPKHRCEDGNVRGDFCLTCSPFSLLSESSDPLSVSHPCLLSHMLLALNARSCGVKLCPTIGKGIHFKILAFSLCWLIYDLSLWPFQAQLFLLHLKLEGRKECGSRNLAMCLQHERHLMPLKEDTQEEARHWSRFPGGVSGAAHPEELEGSRQAAWTRAGPHCWGRFLLPAGPGAQDSPLPVSLCALLCVWGGHTCHHRQKASLSDHPEVISCHLLALLGAKIINVLGSRRYFCSKVAYGLLNLNSLGISMIVGITSRRSNWATEL